MKQLDFPVFSGRLDAIYLRGAARMPKNENFEPGIYLTGARAGARNEEPSSENGLLFAVPLWNHQREALEQFKLRNHLALLHPTGTGKTATYIHCYREACIKDGRLLKALFVAPLIVLENIKREFTIHASEFVAKHVQVVGGDKRKREKDWKESVNKCIKVINYDLLPVMLPELLRYEFEFVCFDESHRLKNPSTKRSKAASLIVRQPQVKYPIIATGSAVLNNILDLQPQLRVLKTGLVPDSWYEFRARYCYDKNANMPKLHYYPDWQPKPGSFEALNAILKNVAHQVDKKEALPDLPDLVRQEVVVHLPPCVKLPYEELERDFVTTINDDTISADIVLVKMLRLQQLCNGIIAGTNKSLPTHKAEALMELLEDLPNTAKAIVWVNFVPLYDIVARICQALQIDYVMLTGEQKSADRQAAIDAFQTDDTVRVCIANQQCASEGVNLYAASYAIYYSKSYNLAHDLQSEARCYRAGSERHEKVTRIDLVTKDTIEEEINVALARKLKLSELVTNIRSKHGTSRSERTNPRSLAA